jgi:cytochrome c-type biogenesis protein CcmH
MQVAAAHAVLPDEKLPDPTLEARALAISKEVRCVVCQNQSIDDSSAPLARDMRIIIRERIAAGDSDEQALDHLVVRYGNFVRLKPPFQANTLILWLGPFAIFLVALAVLVFHIRSRRGASAPEPLTEEERHRLTELLGAETANPQQSGNPA